MKAVIIQLTLVAILGGTLQYVSTELDVTKRRDGQCEVNNGCRPCHCKTGNCDGASGNCEQNECKKGYVSAPGKSNCQIVDIAYNKSTAASSTYEQGGWDSANAVDGEQIDIHSSYDSQCFRSGMIYGDHWWQVDFGSTKFVKWMQLTPTVVSGQMRISNFKVYVSNVTAVDNPDWKESAQLCYSHGYVLETVKTVIDVELDGTYNGRYLILFVYLKDAMNFCKFRVFQCPDNLYGKDCLNECNCLDKTEVCNTITGGCESRTVEDYCNDPTEDLTNILGKYELIKSQLSFVEDKVPCPFGWHRFQDKCYTFSHCGYAALCSHEYHQKSCYAMGGYLTSIYSDEENDFVASVAVRAGGVSVFIGANRDAENSSWTWQHGVPLTYTNWNEGESPYTNAGNCAYMLLYRMKQWWKTECSEKFTKFSSVGAVCSLDLL